ncbi:methyl-accepting chemotaxis protein [Novosphingobium cyanobacteriorum]|uniref:Methyl-accepting chemotaxis protein n=1 Tax=Novosphingobium cyanobacteriorum TaxID=3024215 RepID=A0ABT6CK79_9SPHN|nr:methyl-accepting chemotaxis protein [Novosphingobium cyanobacteriorum]MDF8334227.1 methyl-accepting chemotaxis protein [Novosphingobium cyanobacteriorum]
MIDVKTIKFKLLAGCLILATGAAGSTTLCVLGMSRQDVAMGRMNTATGLLREHMEADMGHDAIRAEVVSIVASRQTTAIDGAAAAAELEQRIDEFEKHMAATARSDVAPTVAGARAAADPAFRSYVATGREIARRAKAGLVPDDQELQNFQRLFAELEGQMSSISDAVQANAELTSTSATWAATQARWIALASMLIILILLAWIARVGRTQMIHPLLLLGQSVRQMAAGKLDVEMGGEGRSDEIGDLSRSAIALRDSLIEARAETKRQAEAIVTSIGAGLSNLARGNLAFRLEQPLAGRFEGLRHDFNAALGELGAAMSKVQGSTIALERVAADIGDAASDLAGRNVRQAAGLEETATAINGLNQRVSGSSEAVFSARAAVDGVGGEVARGGQVIEEAEQAMDRIEAASQEIGKIVSVIDGIAFQTNLLALNAGVEAARAGDAGKGFAVVASEVRALAQRSAEAAREIKDLIGNSSDEIGGGVKLVRDAGASLRSITERMDEINRMMEVVEAGANEQKGSLQSLDETSRQIGKITQSNAAVADQVSNASRTMAQAISEVARELARFEIGEARPRETRRALAA